MTNNDNRNHDEGGEEHSAGNRYKMIRDYRIAMRSIMGDSTALEDLLELMLLRNVSEICP